MFNSSFIISTNKGLFAWKELEKWNCIWELQNVISIYLGAHKLSFSNPHFFWGSQTFTFHHYLIYLYFSSLPSYTQFYFNFHCTLSVKPSRLLRVCLVWGKGREGEGKWAPPLAWFEKLEGRELKRFPPLPFFPLILAPSKLGVLEGGQNLRPIYPYYIFVFPSNAFTSNKLKCPTKINTHSFSPLCLLIHPVNLFSTIHKLVPSA